MALFIVHICYLPAYSIILEATLVINSFVLPSLKQLNRSPCNFILLSYVCGSIQIDSQVGTLYVERDNSFC